MKRPDKEDYFNNLTREYNMERYSEDLENYIYHLKHEKIKENKELRELSETLKDSIIDAFREGRKAGAIFKTQRDNELLAERYLRDLTIKKQKNEN